MIKEKYVGRLSTHDFAYVGDDIYFSALNYNGLYVYHTDIKKTEYLGIFPNEIEDRRHLHGAAVFLDEKIYFAPMNGEAFAIYDMSSNSFSSIPVHPDETKLLSKYYGALIYKKKVVFIPTRSLYIAVIDTVTGQLSFHSNWLTGIDTTIREKYPLVKNGAFIQGDYLYIPYNRDGLLIKMSMNDYTVELISVNNTVGGFVDAIYDSSRDELWLLSSEGIELTRTNLRCEETERYSLVLDEECDYPYLNMLDMKDKIVLVSYQANNDLIFDKESKNFLKQKCDNGEVAEWNAYHYWAKKYSEDMFVIANTGDYLFNIRNVKGENIDSWIMQDKVLELRIHLNHKNMFEESRKLGLSEYINLIEAGY